MKKKTEQFEQESIEPAEEEQEKSKFRERLSYVWMIVVACVAAWLISRYVLINAVIPSESMENLLHNKDRIFGYRLAYLFSEPERYDVVMFKYPVHEDTIYIKRIIGLPGETVEIKDGGIYIDGSLTPIEENYLPEEWVNGNDGYFFEVPEDCYFMLGDNRNISDDARYWQQRALEAGLTDDKEEAKAYTYVHADKIIGRAIFKYYPRFEMFLNI